LRRAIQRYIEDPLADEVLKATDMQPGATVDVDRVPGEEGEEPEVKITITAPKRKREAVGVGAKESASSGGAELESGDDLPDEPEVLPEAPDAPPAAEGSASSEDKPE
jgi:hypothetical protein